MTTKMTGQEIVKKQIELWNSHDANRVAAGYAANATVMDPGYPEPLSGREAIAKDANTFFTAFPDLEFHVTKILEDSDTVAVEGMAAGTHTGPLELPSGMVDPTNKRLEFSWAIFFNMDSEGKVREERRYFDVAGQLAQLGLMQ